MTTPKLLDAHPSSQTLGAYLDGTLGASESAALETHLVNCQACRLESAGVMATIQARRRRKRLLFVVPALAAAAAVLVVWLPRPGPPANGDVLRGDSVSGSLTIEVLAPARDSPLPVAGVTFRWHAAAQAIRYLLTLTDDRGNLLWTTETTDTLAVLPDSVVLGGGRAYLWYVDARLPGARSASSGVRGFRTSP